MPFEDPKISKFNQKSDNASFIIYADLESIKKKIEIIHRQQK